MDDLRRVVSFTRLDAGGKSLTMMKTVKRKVCQFVGT